MKNYGKELILDIHNSSVKERFTEKLLKQFCKELCIAIDMKAMQFNVWEYEDEDEYNEAPPKLKGISCVQFIETSNITIHTLDDMKHVYINIFSCKDFSVGTARSMALKYFGGQIVNETEVDRL